MRKFLLYLSALSILNQSIDVNVSYPSDEYGNSAACDDVDTVFELIVENISGQDNLISDQRNDENIPKNIFLLKAHTANLFYQDCRLVVPYTIAFCKQFQAEPADNFLSKGHLCILTPPPDQVNA